MSGERKSWPLRRLGEVVTVARGSSPRPIADERYFQGGYIPWIKIADATKSGKYLYETKEHVNELGASFSRRLPPYSLIVAASGTLGYTQMLGITGCVHDGWLYVTDFNGVDKHYIFYFLKWKKEHFYNSAYGAAIQNINTQILRDTEIALPPLPVQERIASILSAYDDLIENNTRRIKILEEMAHMIYREWFVNFRFPGHENVRMVDSELGPIPEGWSPKRMTEAVQVNPATRMPIEGFKPFLPMGSLSESSMLIRDADIREGNSGAKFKNGDTLFARITPCLENGKTGYVQFLPQEDSVGFGSTEFIVLRSKTVCPEYVYLMARTSEFRDNAIKSMSGATGRQRVQEACFDRFLIARPDGETLLQFEATIKPVFQLVRNLGTQNSNLRATRDFLLPKLISGEVPVEAAEDTAAELLEQIA